MSIVVIIWLICAAIGASMADHRNRDRLGWAILCGLFGIFGLLALAIAGTKRAS